MQINGRGAEFSSKRTLMKMTRQRAAPPPSPAGSAAFGENSGVSEYLGQHETLDLSRATGPSLCPSLLTHAPQNVRDEC